MMTTTELAHEALSRPLKLTVQPFEQMQQIINTYHYLLSFNDDTQEWKLSKPGYKPIYYTKAKFENLPALLLISDLDINEKE